MACLGHCVPRRTPENAACWRRGMDGSSPGCTVMVSREDELKAARLRGEREMAKILGEQGVTEAIAAYNWMKKQSALTTSFYRSEEGQEYLDGCRNALGEHLPK